MHIKNLSISTKLTAVAVFAAAVAIFCVVVAFVVQDLRLVNRIKANQVDAYTGLLSSSLSALFAADMDGKISDLLRESASDPYITAIAVLDSNSHIVASVNLDGLTDDQVISLPQLRSMVDRPALKSTHSAVHVTPVPITSGNTATLVTYISTLDVRQRVGFMLGYSLMAIVLALMIALTISWLVQRIVTRPLRQLHELSQTIKTSGDYSLRAEVNSGDEIGELAQGVNQMLDQIANRDGVLEKQVERRTQELEGLARAFRYRALHDALTGLPNRALLQEEYYRAAAHANRTNTYFALLLMDLDNFKDINDTLGHEQGDELLKEFSEVLRLQTRREDMACRLGGDEFVVLIEDLASEAMAVQIGENLLKNIQNRLNIKQHEVNVTVSMGVSVFPLHGNQLSVLKHKADVAMYHSKEKGKNRLTLYDTALERVVLHKQLVQADLAKALQREELQLYFQPQVDTKTHTLIAVEALLRWNNAMYGVLPPSEFLGFTSDHTLIRGIDYYVVKSACEQMLVWQSKYRQGIPVSVNLAALHLRNSDIVRVIAENLEEYRLNPGDFIVELPESLLEEDERVARKIADQVSNLGVRIALSSFGVGKSSLHYLRSFPVDIIKLDRSFAHGVTASERESRLARGVIALAQECDLMLVAEGVESLEQEQALQNLGCQVMQGRWYTEPRETLMFEQWLTTFSQHHAA